jgi:urease accessory protein UreF
VSTAMRLMAIGQHEAHALLSTTLARAPVVVDLVMKSAGRPSAFTPALDAASMGQQYVHSRLFRS